MLTALLVAAVLANDWTDAREPTLAARKDNSVRVNLGIASAVGVLGVTYNRQMTSLWQLEGGVGAGLTGAQISVMTKMRIPSPRSSFLMGIGLSLAIPGMKLLDGSTVAVPWLNADLLGYETKTSGGGVFMIAGGVTVALAHGTFKVFQEGATSELFGQTIPQIRVAFGNWF